MAAYVPPHMRNKQGSADGGSSGGVGDSGKKSSSSSGGASKGRSLADRLGSSGFGDSGGSRRGGGGRRDYRGGGGGGYNSRASGFGSYGGYSGGGRFSNEARRNEMGFYGSLRKEPAVERRLFGKQTHTAGINFDKYDDIPVEMSGRECPEGIETFEEMALPESLKENIVRCGYAKPTPIQKYSYGIGIANRDIMACAQTGSGKTGGFLFPAITLVLKAGPVIPEDQAGGSGGRHRGRKAYPSILILAPTRELASQINDEAEKFCYCTGLQPVVVYGGAPIRDQLHALQRGCDLLTATPGRMIDLIERGRVSMSSVACLILDEADRMLDMGFEPQIRRIVEQEDMRTMDERRTFMFSAIAKGNPASRSRLSERLRLPHRRRVEAPPKTSSRKSSGLRATTKIPC